MFVLGEAARGSSAPNGEQRRTIVRTATMEVRRATVYGEAIIAVVYVPILTLTGVEGKLFTPMATTVLLALGGAFILSITLVPVLASLFLRANPKRKETLLMRAATGLYRPLVALVLRFRGLALVSGLGGARAGNRPHGDRADRCLH